MRPGDEGKLIVVTICPWIFHYIKRPRKCNEPEGWDEGYAGVGRLGMTVDGGSRLEIETS